MVACCVLFADNHGGPAARRYGFKLSDSSSGGRWLVFSCRDLVDYRRWLEAFSAERRLVADDQLRGFDVASLSKLNTQLQQQQQQPVRGMQLAVSTHESTPPPTGVATGGHVPSAHPTSARVGCEICTNSKSFFGGAGVEGSRLRMSLKVHRMSSMNTSR